MAISIQFLGAAGCVTGSQFLVTVGERRVLVDCGMFQGSPEETERNRMPFAFEPGSIDAVLLTHAHLDHCGRIPALTKAGFSGPIHATRATVDLAEHRPSRLGEAPGRVHQSLESAPRARRRARRRGGRVGGGRHRGRR